MDGVLNERAPCNVVLLSLDDGYLKWCGGHMAQLFELKSIKFVSRAEPESFKASSLFLLPFLSHVVVLLDCSFTFADTLSVA